MDQSYTQDMNIKYNLDSPENTLTFITFKIL